MDSSWVTCIFVLLAIYILYCVISYNEKMHKDYDRLWYLYFLNILNMEYHKYLFLREITNKHSEAKEKDSYKALECIDFSQLPFWSAILNDFENLIKPYDLKIKPEVVKMMIKQDKALNMNFIKLNKIDKDIQKNGLLCQSIKGYLSVLQNIQNDKGLY